MCQRHVADVSATSWLTVQRHCRPPFSDVAPHPLAISSLTSQRHRRPPFSVSATSSFTLERPRLAHSRFACAMPPRRATQTGKRHSNLNMIPDMYFHATVGHAACSLTARLMPTKREASGTEHTVCTHDERRVLLQAPFIPEGFNHNICALRPIVL